VPAGQRLAWLRRILAHNLIDATRKLQSAKRDVGREVSIEQSVERSSVRIATWLACDLPPGRAIEQEELMVGLAAALGRLPSDEREALVLHYSSDWTLAQIAEHLGRTRESVAGLIKRGVRRLRAELKQAESVHDRRRR
jgi:RNA polymerase sigma-70 factor (ECF subfamily)